MSREALLELQRALVAELTGPQWLEETPRALPPPLDGIDAERVALLARLTQGKRLGKIAKRLPATFEALAPQLPALVADFAADHPLSSPSGYHNAVQFYRFLSRRNRSGRLTPAWIKDLAACELAVAVVSQRDGDEEHSSIDWEPSGAVTLRRSRDAVFLVCEHDVRALLQGRSHRCEQPSVPVRSVCLAVVPDPSAGTTRIVELEPSAFTWLRGLRRWRELSLDDLVGDDGALALLKTLTSIGLLRVRSVPSAP